MTAPTTSIHTGLVKPDSLGALSLRELLELRESGDSALDRCLRRVAEEDASSREDRVAAFNASPPRPV
jgi:FXSXX-COOH protein